MSLCECRKNLHDSHFIQCMVFPPLTAICKLGQTAVYNMLILCSGFLGSRTSSGFDERRSRGVVGSTRSHRKFHHGFHERQQHDAPAYFHVHVSLIAILHFERLHGRKREWRRRFHYYHSQVFGGTSRSYHCASGLRRFIHRYAGLFATCVDISTSRRCFFKG